MDSLISIPPIEIPRYIRMQTFARADKEGEPTSETEGRGGGGEERCAEGTMVRFRDREHRLRARVYVCVCVSAYIFIRVRSGVKHARVRMCGSTGAHVRAYVHA